MNLNDNSVYRLKVNPKRKILDISDTLYGIFFEDINRCADGGIYAEMVQNRSFECFSYNCYNDQSTEDGKSGGRNHTPLRYWYGDLDKVKVLCDGGLEEYFNIDKVGDGLHYINVKSGAWLFNRGFGGEKEECGMRFIKDETYNFSIYVKTVEALISVTLLDSEGKTISDTPYIKVDGCDWTKCSIVLRAEKDCIGQLCLGFEGDCSIDMVSLIPNRVWGSRCEDPKSDNFLCNSNYRLRHDLMQALYEMKPAFIRFPGGCISEGSFTWDNVYDWKDSIGDPAIRRENFNVWGYNMTMGLGYMEYFQMAEDLEAEPLPVMACGILCQARSDYANPAGGKLREKYIKNFTDLIDFAISEDFEGNKWAAIRRDMGHPKPFGLHYLGIGNENWGDEFFADFEIFYHEIKEYIDKNYPDQGIRIISTVGAQADDDAMKRGWSFLCGGRDYGSKCRFTDGEKSWEEDVFPYRHHKQYLDTIADEHYYRNNQYLLENADRYNYYQRGSYTGAPAEVEKEGLIPQVFVGEYASTDKNTLRGAVCEAATMTGFERNGDIVRMAATAPLFNQPMDDETYRWTPDCIWFDKQNVYRTPTYYVQQLFMKNTGSRLLETREFADDSEYLPCGGYALSGSFGSVKLLKATVEEKDGKTFEIDFTKLCSESSDVAEILKKCGLKASNAAALSTDGTGIIIDAGEGTEYLYCEDELYRIKVSLTAVKLSETAVVGVGTGLRFSGEKITITKYCVGDDFHGTGLKVMKNGVEGYTLGDFSSSVYAGNLRNYYLEKVPTGKNITAVIDFGCSESESLKAYYTVENGEHSGEIYCRLSAHPDRIYSSATADDEYVYIKLVNAYDREQKATVELPGVADNAELTVLTATPDLIDAENVNFGGEKVTPKTTGIKSAGNGVFETVLSSQSVNILKVRING